MDDWQEKYHFDGARWRERETGYVLTQAWPQRVLEVLCVNCGKRFGGHSGGEIHKCQGHRDDPNRDVGGWSRSSSFATERCARWELDGDL